VARRGRYDPLRTLDEPAWCVVTDAIGRVLTWLRFDPGTNLRQQFALLTERAMVAGWTVEDADPRLGGFFCHREGDRLYVSIRPTAPQNPLSDWPLPAPAACIEECFNIQTRRSAHPGAPP
jgi:hypothetical protein